jgi:hypothetical protein
MGETQIREEMEGEAAQVATPSSLSISPSKNSRSRELTRFLNLPWHREELKSASRVSYQIFFERCSIVDRSVRRFARR